jgi:hypothetical protein
MSGQHYYLLSVLPALGDMGSSPPIARAGLLVRVAEADGPVDLVEVLLLADDLRQREGALAGELQDDQIDPAVLTEDQIRDRQPLPAHLVPEEPEHPPAVAADLTWAAYYRWAARVAREAGSELLAEWVGYEVALRNALAAARAKALGLDAEAYAVATELAGEGDEAAAAVSEWSAAGDSFSALRALDTSRWSWLTAREAWFTFGDDELVAYTAKLGLLHRWCRVQERRAKPRHRRPVRP